MSFKRHFSLSKYCIRGRVTGVQSQPESQTFTVNFSCVCPPTKMASTTVKRSIYAEFKVIKFCRKDNKQAHMNFLYFTTTCIVLGDRQ